MTAWDGFVSPDNIAMGLAVIGALGVSAIGFIAKRGKAGSQDVEVAGALIDRVQARDLIAALDRNTAALERNTAQERQHLQELQENGRELRRLTDEVIRGGGVTHPPYGRKD